MIDWNQVLGTILPPGGAVTVLGVLVNYLIKRRRGRLTRADQTTERATRAEKLAARYLAYIYLLHARWPEGTPRPPWPRGLKPKD